MWCRKKKCVFDFWPFVEKKCVFDISRSQRQKVVWNFLFGWATRTLTKPRSYLIFVNVEKKRYSNFIIFGDSKFWGHFLEKKMCFFLFPAYWKRIFSEVKPTKNVPPKKCDGSTCDENTPKCPKKSRVQKTDQVDRLKMVDFLCVPGISNSRKINFGQIWLRSRKAKNTFFFHDVKCQKHIFFPHHKCEKKSNNFGNFFRFISMFTLSGWGRPTLYHPISISSFPEFQISQTKRDRKMRKYGKTAKKQYQQMSKKFQNGQNVEEKCFKCVNKKSENIFKNRK